MSELLERTFLAAARHAGDRAMPGCVAKLGSGEHDARSLTSAGRIPAEQAAALWRKGRSKVGQAQIAAATCGDGDLLARMVAQERRQGVLQALVQNPSTPIGALLEAYGKINHSWRDTTVQRILKERLVALPLEEVESYASTGAGVVLEALGAHPELSAEVVLRNLEGLQATRLAAVVLERRDLPGLGGEVLRAVLKVRGWYGAIEALEGNPRLFELEEVAFRYLLDSGSGEVLAERSDLPEGLKRWLLDEAAARDDDDLWEAIAGNEEIDREELLAARINPWRGDILGRVLQHRFGDDPEMWEGALGLYGSFEGRTFRELVEALEALQGV